MLMFGIILPLLLLFRLLAINVHFRLPFVLLALDSKCNRACTVADLLLSFFPDFVFAGGYFESTRSLSLAQP